MWKVKNWIKRMLFSSELERLEKLNEEYEGVKIKLNEVLDRCIENFKS